MTNAIRRRTWLQALGLGSAAGLTPSLLKSKPAVAAGERRHLGIMFTEHGVIPQNFYFSRGNLPRTSAWEFPLEDMAESDFSAGLRPLWRHRKKIIIVEGLVHFTAMSGAGDDHGRGVITATTGSRATSSDGPRSNSNHPSLDQIVAADLRTKDPSLTALTSLVMGSSNNSFPFHHDVWAKSGTGVTKVPLEGDYAKIHSRLFGNLPTGMAKPSDPISAHQEKLMAMVSAEYERVGKLGSSEDRLRLDQHRQMLSDLSKRLTVAPAASCEKPPSPSAGDHKRNITAMIKLSTAAWNCGITRVSHHRLFQIPNSLVGASGDFHQDYAHRWNTNAEATRGCSEADKLHAGWAAEWADELERLPNGKGGTLLDSSTIMWTGEIANGGHGHNPIHMVLIGGGDGTFKTGRYINIPKDTRGHNHVLVSLARMMGVDINQVGEATTGRSLVGPLVELAG